ncbi:MAG: tRNA (adenosine(37)-N6)-threonylcarbamoyltransferase complex ATPase subunit type 1 TsaE [Candidatus Dormibacteria bacterium]
MNRLAVRSRSVADTERLGARLGAALRAGDVLELEGVLGAGKTCLVRGMVAGAGGDAAAVRSPTFVLHQPHACRDVVVHHIDLYRLGPGANVDFLDIDALREGGALVVEWGSYAAIAATARLAITTRDGDDRDLALDAGAAAAHLAAAWSDA